MRRARPGGSNASQHPPPSASPRRPPSGQARGTNHRTPSPRQPVPDGVHLPASDSTGYRRPSGRPASAIVKSDVKSGTGTGSPRIPAAAGNTARSRRPSTAPLRRPAPYRPSSANPRRHNPNDTGVVVPTLRMSDLTALREVAAASPSLDHLGAAHTVARKSPRGGRSSSAIIAPRPLSASGASPSATGAASPYRNGPARRAVSAGMSGARRSIQSGASTSAGGASSTRHGANARPSSAQNWEPKVALFCRLYRP